MNGLRFTDEVSDALEARRAVVALESTIISHGMPYPQNLEMARDVEDIVRSAGATPATIAVIDGVPRIGLDTSSLETLATSADVTKVSMRDLPAVIAKATHGATTVAATMHLAALAGITVFATGGIGGVHRGAQSSFDISNDLAKMATTNVAVVSAGVKSILDIGLTLEALETLGIPVVCFGTDEFPSFYSRTSGFAAPLRCDSADEIARLMEAKWNLEMTGAVSIANPIPAGDEIAREQIDSIIDDALRDAAQAGVGGKDTTPYLLRRIVELTGGASLRANIALVKNNARVAAEIAVAYAGLGR